MNICIVAPYEYPIPAIKGGAIEQIVDSICKVNENEKKINITVLATYDPDMPTEQDMENTRFVYFDKSAWDKTWFFAFRIIKKILNIYIPAYPRFIDIRKWLMKNEQNFDLIVYMDGLTWMLGYLFSGIDPAKVVNYMHWVGAPSNELGHYFNNLFAVSEFVKNYWINETGDTSKNYYVIRNGIKLEKFSKTLSRQEQISLKEEYGLSDEYIVLYVGRLVEEKGVLELVKAINSLKENVVLLVVGAAKFANKTSTNYEQQVLAEIDKCPSKYRMLGFIDNTELYKVQQISDVAVIPSLCEEAATLVSVEYMAAGLPIIATNLGGLPEYAGGDNSIILDLEGLYRYRKGKKVDISGKEDDVICKIKTAIIELMKNETRREFMSRCAIKRAEYFSETAMYNNFVNALFDIVAQNVMTQ